MSNEQKLPAPSRQNDGEHPVRRDGGVLDDEATFVAKAVEEQVKGNQSGFWRACSGCQESDEGYVSAKLYPFSRIFKCQPGGGCRECGGIGVIWDNTDYAELGDFVAEGGEQSSRKAGGTAVNEEALEVSRRWESWYNGIVADFIGLTDNREDPSRVHDWEWIDAHRPPPAPYQWQEPIAAAPQPPAPEGTAGGDPGPDRNGMDGTARLCRALYGRKEKARDYIGGSDARMLHDAADRIEAFASSTPTKATTGPVEADGWQDIDTAPKDGTLIWLYWPEPPSDFRQGVGLFYAKSDREQYWTDVGDNEQSEPTHWRPLPSPPAKIQREHEGDAA